MFYLDRLTIIGVMNLKLISLLLFFEHRYLSYYQRYRPENFCVFFRVSLEVSMSQIFHLGPSFYFMSKNG